MQEWTVELSKLRQMTWIICNSNLADNPPVMHRTLCSYLLLPKANAQKVRFTNKLRCLI